LGKNGIICKKGKKKFKWKPNKTGFWVKRLKMIEKN